MQDPYEDEDDYELKPSEGKADNGRVRPRRVVDSTEGVCPGRRASGLGRPRWTPRASSWSLPNVLRPLMLGTAEEQRM